MIFITSKKFNFVKTYFKHNQIVQTPNYYNSPNSFNCIDKRTHLRVFFTLYRQEMSLCTCKKNLNNVTSLQLPLQNSIQLT